MATEQDEQNIVISAPANFVHVAHVGYDGTRKEYTNLPIHWEAEINKATDKPVLISQAEPTEGPIGEPYSLKHTAHVTFQDGKYQNLPPAWQSKIDSETQTTAAPAGSVTTASRGQLCQLQLQGKMAPIFPNGAPKSNSGINYCILATVCVACVAVCVGLWMY
ncbi:hypothetical protein Pelo_2160 [Pelomyxa schiedti]|nr:hypothetical protein Pelo_2160 [Pelomyxa schiedti]